MKERAVEQRLVDGVRARGGWCIKVVPVSQAGLPDRLALLPGGRVRFVELKRPKGGVASAVQVRVHARLARLGFPVALLFTPEEVDAWLDVL